MEIVGYTHSDGYCLCPEHAEYGEMKDTRSGDGVVTPIYDTEETDTDLICDACYTELFATGGNVNLSIILEQNIDLPLKKCSKCGKDIPENETAWDGDEEGEYFCDPCFDTLDDEEED